MELFEAVKGRRSIRKYDPERPVPDEIIDRLVDMARWAPSWANTQCVRYIIVRDPERREKLAGTLSPKNPSTKAFSAAPVVIAFVAALEKSGYYKGKASDDKAWHLFDTGLAVQNFCLAAHALGLGTVICGAMDYHAAEDLLGTPPGYQVVAMTPLGYPAKEARGPARREVSGLRCNETWSALMEEAQ
ncbi:MAG: nitroreductase [Planctomycetota bacterium]|nr:MAG: nitroreductase [Planctomycetota bacterium]